MASATEAAATQQQYLAQVALTATMSNALAGLAQHAQPGTDAYRNGLQAIIDQLAQVSASIARDYYQQIRVDGGITAPISIKPIDPPPASKIDASIAYALRSGSTTVDAADFQAAVQKRIEAANQKILADAAREQVATAVAGDELAIGFRRVPRPDACAFCILMATRSSRREGLAVDLPTGSNNNDRGITYGGTEHFGVYKSRASAEGKTYERDFIGEGTAKFHNHCHCVVEPVFSAVEKLPAWLEDARQLYLNAEVDPNRPDDTTLNAFRRALNAQRSGNRGPTSPIAPAVPLRAASTQPSIAALLQGLDDAYRAGAA